MPDSNPPPKPNAPQAAPESENVEKGRESRDDAGSPGASSAANPHPTYSPAQKVLIAFLVLVIAATLTFFVRGIWKIYFTRPGAAASHSGPMPMIALPKPCGDPNAPVQVDVCVGHCFAPLLTNFHDILAAWPHRVHVTFSVVHSPTGQRLLKRYNASCASIFINGKTKFRVKRGNRVRPVELHGPPGDSYQLEDVAWILRRELAKTPGGLPADFETRIRPLLHSGFGESSETAPGDAAPKKRPPQKP